MSRETATSLFYCRFCGAPPVRASMTCADENCRRLWRNERMRTYLRSRTADQWPRCDTCGDKLNRNRNCARCRRRDEVQRRAIRRIEAAAAGTRGSRVFVAGNCQRCGSAYLGRRNRPDTNFCSKLCKQRESAGRRRARLAGASEISAERRLAVFVRDDWTCQLCGLRVSQTLRVPSPEAPVLDHIMPLARGGNHVPENLQTAHFLCNSRKRDLLSWPEPEALRAKLIKAVETERAATNGPIAAARSASRKRTRKTAARRQRPTRPNRLAEVLPVPPAPTASATRPTLEWWETFSKWTSKEKAGTGQNVNRLNVRTEIEIPENV